MRTYNDDDVAALKLKHSLPRIIEPELSAFGLTLILSPFTAAGFDRWADEALKDAGNANEAALIRHALFHTPAELKQMRTRCAGLPKIAADALAADAGFPSFAPARWMADALDAETPTGVLAQVGLDEAKAAELLVQLGARKAKVVAVIDDAGDLIFGCVIGAPGDAETTLIRRAATEKKGYAQAIRGAADGCIVWTRDAIADTWARYPAIALVLAEVIGSLGGTSTTARFRRR